MARNRWTAVWLTVQTGMAVNAPPSVSVQNVLRTFGSGLKLEKGINTYSHTQNLGYPILLVFNNSHYYMASSASGQDEPNRALWLATRAGKMEPSCPLGTTRCIPQAKFHQKPYNKSFIDQVCSVKMAGYWPRSFFANLWTSTSSRSINTQKKNLANIQPSWPHTWSITHVQVQVQVQVY